MKIDQTFALAWWMTFKRQVIPNTLKVLTGKCSTRVGRGGGGLVNSAMVLCTVVVKVGVSLMRGQISAIDFNTLVMVRKLTEALEGLAVWPPLLSVRMVHI